MTKTWSLDAACRACLHLRALNAIVVPFNLGASIIDRFLPVDDTVVVEHLVHYALLGRGRPV